jgi:type VI secretion system secreted protein Hcp
LKKLLLIVPLILLIFGVYRHVENKGAKIEVQDVYAAQVDYFLKIPGVDGEASERGGEIEILSWSWGETQETGLLVPAVQKVREAASKGAVAQEIVFETRMSKASPILMQYAASGKHIDEEVVLVGKRFTDPEPYLLIKMKPVFISSYQTGGSAGDVVPMDNFSLNFGSIKFEYKPQKEDGKLDAAVEGSWDFEKNKPVE